MLRSNLLQRTEAPLGVSGGFSFIFRFFLINNETFSRVQIKIAFNLVFAFGGGVLHLSTNQGQHSPIVQLEFHNKQYDL